MAILSYVYTDIALTSAFDDASPLTIDAPNGSANYGVIYIGTPTSGTKLQATSNPGVDDITVTPQDAAGGSGVETSNIKLADDPGSFGSVVAGDPINLGVEITFGNPAAVYVQFDNDVLTGTQTDANISLIIAAMTETNT